MTPSDINVDRLIRVRDQFVDAPESLAMDDYITGVYNESNELCGTASCIGGAAALDAGFIVLRQTPRAGTMALLYDVTPEGKRIREDSAKLDVFNVALGLDQRQSDRLFFVTNWPAGHRKEFESAKTPAARARVTARRIDQFLATGGRE